VITAEHDNGLYCASSSGSEQDTSSKVRRSRVCASAHDHGFPSVANFRKHLRMLSRVIYEHRRFLELFEMIGRCHCISGTRGRKRGFTIVGYPGAGKSTLARYYRRCFPRCRMKNGVMWIPVLYVEVPSKPTKRSFLKAILRALGEKITRKMSADDIEERIDYWIVKCRVQIILIDEFHHVIDRASSNVQGEVADFLKEFTDRHPISVVLFGLPHCTEVFENANYGQLRDRIGKPQWLGPMEPIEAQVLLEELDEAQPFPRIGLADNGYREKMGEATGFYPGRITSIVAGAVENATWHGKDSIKEEDIWYGFERWIQTSSVDGEDPGPKENPFSPPSKDSGREPLPVNRIVAVVKSTMRIPAHRARE
jgi:type II secretory pathway predicted ATPase ExeA